MGAKDKAEARLVVLSESLEKIWKAERQETKEGSSNGGNVDPAFRAARIRLTVQTTANARSSMELRTSRLPNLLR